MRVDIGDGLEVRVGSGKPKGVIMGKGRPVANKHKVPKKKWNKWSRAARKMFNDMMYSMRPRLQWAYLHPNAKLMPREHWQTTRWNASWIAADLVDNLGVLKKVVVNGQAKRG